MARVHSMVVESLMDDEENQIRGYTHLNDESGLTMSHLSAWSFTDIRNMLRCIQNSTPMRHKETHLINIPGSVAKIIEFAISLLNDKLKSRVMVNITNYSYINLHDWWQVTLTDTQGYGGAERSDRSEDTAEGIRRRNSALGNDRYVMDSSRHFSLVFF